MNPDKKIPRTADEYIDAAQPSSDQGYGLVGLIQILAAEHDHISRVEKVRAVGEFAVDLCRSGSRKIRDVLIK